MMKGSRDRTLQDLQTLERFF
jgi:hypothetical protein